MQICWGVVTLFWAARIVDVCFLGPHWGPLGIRIGNPSLSCHQGCIGFWGSPALGLPFFPLSTLALECLLSVFGPALGTNGNPHWESHLPGPHWVLGPLALELAFPVLPVDPSNTLALPGRYPSELGLNETLMSSFVRSCSLVLTPTNLQTNAITTA